MHNQVGAPEEQERFWARLNTLGIPGTEVILVLSLAPETGLPNAGAGR